jgi:hypothetical protein
MHCLGRIAIAALTVFALASVRAEVLARPKHPVVAAAHACLSLKERRAANESGKVVHLAAAIRAAKRRMPGSAVKGTLLGKR